MHYANCAVAMRMYTCDEAQKYNLGGLFSSPCRVATGMTAFLFCLSACCTLVLLSFSKLVGVRYIVTNEHQQNIRV
jgi:hypothetical protein